MGRGAGRAESRFAAARPGTAGVYTPRPRYGGQIAFWGLGAERQTGLCATQREGGCVGRFGTPWQLAVFTI